MSNITRETRDESYQAVLPTVGNIQEAVFAAVKSSRAGLTAEEVKDAAGCSLNSARSRLTELTDAGRLVVVGKRRNKADTRNVAVWDLNGA